MNYDYRFIPEGKFKRNSNQRFKMVKQEQKEWYQSKTLWIGALTVMAGIATAVAADVAAGVPLTIVGLLNIIIRVTTKAELVVTSK